MTDENPPDPSIPTYPDWDNTDTILSSFFWGYVVFQIGAGQIGEHFGPRYFVTGTMILGSIFNVLIPVMAQAVGPTGVIVCRVIQGLNQGFLYPSTHVLISQWTPLSERTRVSSMVYSGSSLGIVISMILSGAIADSSLGWPSVFYIYGSAGIIWGIIFGIFIVNSPSEHKTITEEERKYIQSSNSVTKDQKKVPTPWKSIFTSLPIWAIFITSCAQAWGTFTLLTEIPSFLNSVMNFDMNSNSQLSALPYCLMFIINFVASPISDKLISNKTVSVITARKICNSISCFMPSAALFALGFVDGTQQELAMAMLIVAVGMSSVANSGGLVNVIDLAPNHAGTLFGMTNGCSQIFSIMGPLTVGFLGTDKKDLILWRKVFWLASGIYLGCGLFYVIFAKGEVQKWNDKDSDEVESKNKEKSSENF
ncbi:hypothetical protein Zmor_013865 [Zophobas morio]|uniref:Putative inorganic phosphate cotransporter n=2 Tax=Zophobas morio TaxID=2755281 RepID=A0AA38IDT7_9CUCU|nr:hypothetical protein Zmor_013865 [Zophobas morio]